MSLYSTAITANVAQSESRRQCSSSTWCYFKLIFFSASTRVWLHHIILWQSVSYTNVTQKHKDFTDTHATVPLISDGAGLIYSDPIFVSTFSNYLQDKLPKYLQTFVVGCLDVLILLVVPGLVLYIPAQKHPGTQLIRSNVTRLAVWRLFFFFFNQAPSRSKTYCRICSVMQQINLFNIS